MNPSLALEVKPKSVDLILRAPPPPSLSFFSLPIHVRMRIYYFADVTRQCPIVIIRPSHAVARSARLRHPLQIRQNGGLICNFASRRRGHEPHLSHETLECECPAVPKQLLLVSTALYQEVRDILYGGNCFVLRAHQPKDFDPLQRLSNDSLRAMNHLLIRLNCWPCYRGHTSPNLRKISTTGKCGVCSAPVSKSDPEMADGDGFEQLKQQWAALCRHLASCIEPGRLNLEFICDVLDLKTGHQIVEPLKMLPWLKSCVIRLGRRRDPYLRSLACSTALSLTTPPQQNLQKLCFPFLSLPCEVRHRILGYTNLGPGGSFKPEWGDITVKHGKFDQSKPGRYLDYLRKCCLSCSFTNLDCSCSLNYVSFSPNCKCRDLPLDLFLVSWQVYADAAQVLFTTNTFLFEGPFIKTLDMLQSLGSLSLRSFRRIKFCLEPRQIFNWEKERDDWLSLISFLATKFDTSHLLITFNTEVDEESCSELDYKESTMRGLYDGYIFFMRTIKSKLPALLDFYVKLGVFFRLEPVFEQYIMGSNFDSKNANRYVKASHSFEDDPDADGEAIDVPYWHTDL